MNSSWKLRWSLPPRKAALQYYRPLGYFFSSKTNFIAVILLVNKQTTLGDSQFTLMCQIFKNYLYPLFLHYCYHPPVFPNNSLILPFLPSLGAWQGRVLTYMPNRTGPCFPPSSAPWAPGLCPTQDKVDFRAPGQSGLRKLIWMADSVTHGPSGESDMHGWQSWG